MLKSDHAWIHGDFLAPAIFELSLALGSEPRYLSSVSKMPSHASVVSMSQKVKRMLHELRDMCMRLLPGFRRMTMVDLAPADMFTGKSSWYIYM